MSTLNSKNIPKDGQVIMAILEEIGIDDFDPRVLNQLLEFVNWYTITILDDARLFANHAKKKNIDVDDIKLAIQMHAEQMSASGPPRDILLEMARTKNAVSLPVIKPQAGIRLPPDRYCLTQPNYILKSNLPTCKTAVASNNMNQVQSSGNQDIKLSLPSGVKMLKTVTPHVVPESVRSVTSEPKVFPTTAGNDVFHLDIQENSTNQSEVKVETKIEFMGLEHLNDHY